MINNYIFRTVLIMLNLIFYLVNREINPQRFYNDVNFYYIIHKN